MPPLTTSQCAMRKVALASAIGTTVEWYDYFIFGTAAALVFGTAFFPELSPLAGHVGQLRNIRGGISGPPLGCCHLWPLR